MGDIDLRAIIPGRFHNSRDAKKSIDKLLLNFMANAQKELETYPAAQPWKNPPRTGLRAGGKRTGTLGRGWTAYELKSGQSITMRNPTTYGSYVQGTAAEQARALARRGWPRVDEVGKRAALKAIKDTNLMA